MDDRSAKSKSFIKYQILLTGAILSLLPFRGFSAQSQACDVLISGGSLAALTAALSSAREGVSTCLIEPTDWPGGQMTASGVPAIDFAWHRIANTPIQPVIRNPANLEENLRLWTSELGNPGSCWVSHHCFSPKELLEKRIYPALRAEKNLTVYYNTVVKEITKSEDQITGVKLIQREPKNGPTSQESNAHMPSQPSTNENPPQIGDNRSESQATTSQSLDTAKLLSQEIIDWYSETESALFRKKEIWLKGNEAPKIFVDGSENGDLLALSSDSFTTGADDISLDKRDSTCGQATVYTFVVNGKPGPSINLPEASHPEFYSLGKFSWDKVWTYRRLLGNGTSFNLGEKSLQNWNPGNDYPFGYIWLSEEETKKSRSQWMGGYNVDTLSKAEEHAYGWYEWFKNAAPKDVKDNLSLDKEALGTSHGLAKYPYIRDTRRSIGIDGYRLSLKEIRGDGILGTKFFDRVALHTYAIDIHPLSGKSCYAVPKDTKTSSQEPPPFYIPFRALTNRDIKNLIVVGKTMAQTFLVNASTRVHPGEMASGTAGGVAAAYMVKNGMNDTRQVLKNIQTFRKISSLRTPSDWTGYPAVKVKMKVKNNKKN